LIELELFNDQVEIVQEGLFDVSSDVVVKSWLDVVGFIGLLNFLDPHVKRVKLLFNKVVKVILCVEDSVNRAHQEREKCQSNELKNNRKNVLLRSLACIVTITYGGDDFEDPIERENVQSSIISILEVLVPPRLYTFGIFGLIFATLHCTKPEP